MINNFKLTGEIHNDIPTVCEAIEYAKALVDGFVEEATGKMNIKEHPNNTAADRRSKIHLILPNNTAVFVDMLELQNRMAQAKSCTDHLAWDEKRRFYGPLADRDDIFIGKYD